MLLLSTVMVGCKTPQALYDQGLEKIGKAIELDSTLTLPIDTIYGKDSIQIITSTIVVPCEEKKKPTLRENRFTKQKLRDSMRHVERMYKLQTKRLEDSLDYTAKLNKELTKRIKTLSADSVRMQKEITKQLDDLSNTEVKLAKEKTKQTTGGWIIRMLGKFWWLVAGISLIIGFVFRGYLPF